MNPKTQTASTPGVAYDVQLLFPVLFLVGVGIVMVYSASSALALKKFDTDYFFLKKQAIFALLGIISLVMCRHFPYRLYRKLAYPLLGVAIMLLVLVKFSAFGFSAGGSSRWLRLGIFTFQPSEFARIALVIFMAYSLDKKGDQLKNFSIGFIPHVFVFGLFAGIIALQPDFGSVVILGTITYLMMFVGGVRMVHLFLSLIVMLPLVYYFLISADYRLKRITAFLNPWSSPANEGYQMVHSLMAFGTGGLWGTGIGKGYQKLFYLPEPHTDFIFSVIGEELGLVGVLVIIVLYALIVIKGIQIAKNARDTFGALLAVGLTSALGLQISINMGVTLGLLPTKGLTLPFLSYGGSSLLLNMASIGILMNVGASKNG
jgi:cell division protein FtsW